MLVPYRRHYAFMLASQLEQKKQAEKVKRDELNDLHLDLVEKQRLYFKTVKDFQQVSLSRVNQFHLYDVSFRSN